ncbi:hypothetical protein GCM10023175_59700 [Pseudonocardia xishanensis]|uniref:Glycosyltransferase subfamily 4-like N-terminal domain-containing protein n=1 Tax=Pseudonocardia xishanensis TaxID=630995 RepID=A0ABP8S0U8_9PSEU
MLLLAHSIEGGGAQEVCRAWARALNGRHEVRILVLDRSAGLAEARAALTGIPVACAEEVGAASHRSRVAHVRREVVAWQPDVLVSLETYPNLVALSATAGLRTRTVVSEHNVPSILLKVEGPAKRAQLALARLFYRRADTVICVSHAVATDIRCNFGVPPERVAVLPNGVLGGEVDAPDVTASPSRITILVPARLVPQKRPAHCVAIAEALARRGARVTLVWVGDGPPDSPALRPTRGAPTVEIVREPWRDDWHLLADEETVVLLGSAYEGFGNVLVESASRGIPVVAGSSALGCADAVVPGVTGYLAATDSAESYADAISEARLLSAPFSADNWLRQFSAAATARRLETVLRPSTLAFPLPAPAVEAGAGRG